MLVQDEKACATNRKYYSDDLKQAFCADYLFLGKNATHCNFTYNFNSTKKANTIQTLCTETEDKDSYCPYPTDAAEWKEMLNTLFLIVNNKEFSEGHVSYKENIEGFDDSLFRKIVPVLEYPKFKGADECMIKLYLSAGFIKCGLFVIALVLFIIFA